ncbi:MAG TPA: hypothetical protein VHT91_23560 [Kofleriaceae bacterium]|jgi:hypothetical protein|nr:hypothetical protein [Kofleriaceae bacterium]
MTRALALICCAASFLASHAASAKPSRVALTQIEGDATGDVRDAVAEALEGKELSLIASREVNRAVDKLGDLSDLTEKDFKKLASELDADAVVAGKLDKVGSAKTLKFRMFIHKKMAKGFTVSFKDAKSEKFRTLLHDKILDKIGAGSAGSGGDDEEDARPAKKKKPADDDEDPLAKKDRKAKKAKDAKDAKDAKADADDEDARPAKKTRAAKAEDDDARPAKKKPAEDDDARPARKKPAEDDDARPAKKQADADGDARAAGDDDAGSRRSDDGAAPRKAKKRVAAADDDAEVEATAAPIAEPARGANRAAIRLDVGGSVVQRSFKFNTRQLPTAPRDTSLSPVPGARLDGEIYPLAIGGSQGAAANLGVGFDYDKTLSLHINVPRTGMPAVSVAAKQSHYAFGLRYRLAFGRTETSSTLTLGVDYGKQLFSTDLAAAGMDDTVRTALKANTPETEYTMIEPGVVFRLPVTRMVAFALGGRGMVVTKAGPIGTASSYGKARVYGAGGLAALDIVLGQHLGLRLSGEFTQIGFSFLGAGALTDPDGNGQADVGGLADRSIGGAATLTLLY